MIPKGNQRGGGQQLAAHLQNSYDNDRVEVADLRGAVAPDLSGAFAEWHAQSKATKCKKYLYSLSLNPDQRQGKLTRAQYLDFIARAEKRMGLENQPRAVVFHVEQGREHCHVVWSRIDAANMRAVQMSNDHQKLRLVTQEFAKDHNLALPEGLKKDKGRDRYENQKKTADLGEKQQEERSGFGKAARMQSITETWKTTESGEEFIRALAAKDFFLARGDRRSYVVVDLAGEIHSLSRQIKGVKTAEIKNRLSVMPLERLPSAEKAQAHAREVREHRQATQEKPAVGNEGPTPAERRAALQHQQQQRRLALDAEREKLTLRHAREAGQLTLLQASINAGIITNRQEKQVKGVAGFLMRITGVGLIVDITHRIQDKERVRRQETEMTALKQRHSNERQDTDRQLRAIERIERREAKSLETAIRREAFQKIAAPSRQRGDSGKSQIAEPKPPILTPEQAARVAQMKAVFNAKGAKTPLPQKKRSALSDAFDRARKPDAPKTTEDKPQIENDAPKDGLRAAFAPAANPEQPRKPDQPNTRASALAEEFNRRAREKDWQIQDLDKDRERHYRKPPADYTVRR